MTKKAIVIAYKDGVQFKQVFNDHSIAWAVYYRLKREGYDCAEVIPYGQWVCLCVLTTCIIGILIVLVTSYIMVALTMRF